MATEEMSPIQQQYLENLKDLKDRLSFAYNVLSSDEFSLRDVISFEVFRDIVLSQFINKDIKIRHLNAGDITIDIDNVYNFKLSMMRNNADFNINYSLFKKISDTEEIRVSSVYLSDNIIHCLSLMYKEYIEQTLQERYKEYITRNSINYVPINIGK